MGGATTTPWKSSTLTIEQNGTLTPFTVGDTGSSTPSFQVTPKGDIVTKGTTTTAGVKVTSNAALNKVMTSDAKGFGSWQVPKLSILASDGASYTTTNTATTTLKTVVVSSNTFGANDEITAKAFFFRSSGSTDSGHVDIAFGNGSSTTTLNSLDPTNFVACGNAGCEVTARIHASNSTSAQRSYGSLTSAAGYTPTSDQRVMANDMDSMSFAASGRLYVAFRAWAKNGADTFTITGITVTQITP
jgi:hypothetical protein